MTDDSDGFLDRLEELAEAATEAADTDDAAAKARAEKEVVARARETVVESQVSDSDVNMAASALSDELDHYTKTDLKQELSEAAEQTAGTPINKVIEKRLDRILIVKTTDHKQGSVFQWEFDDGVQLETKTDDGQRMHNSWPDMRQSYFDARAAMGEVEQIAEPEDELSDAADWVAWVEDLIQKHSETDPKVGPRTKAVHQLRDFVERSPAYIEMKDVRDRSGVGIDANPGQDIDSLSDDTEIYVPQQQVASICDQCGVSERALQIELDARGLTSDTHAGVSDSRYIGVSRYPFWVITLKLAEPAELIEDPKDPAQQVAQQQSHTGNTSVGNGSDVATDGLGSPQTDSDGEQTGTDDKHTGSDESQTDSDGTGVTDTFGVDPDDGGEEDGE